jgi:hypothetical protein
VDEEENNEEEEEEEDEMTQLFLKTMALYEIHKSIQHQKWNFLKHCSSLFCYFTATNKHYSGPSLWTLHITTSGPASTVHFVMT